MKVKNDDDEEVGKEVVYEPLEVDPNLSRWSDFVATLIPDRRAYFGMTIHAVYLLHLKPTMDLYHYFIGQGNAVQRFDRIILNLSIDVLHDGRISPGAWTCFSIEMDPFQHTPWLIITSFTYQPALDSASGLGSFTLHNTRYHGKAKQQQPPP